MAAFSLICTEAEVHDAVILSIKFKTIAPDFDIGKYFRIPNERATLPQTEYGF